ncbi:uncharacterized protein LOC117584463 isoform X2 [Drosophila guanche]|uniref:Blast:Zinc finger protein 346 n=1 Tax=Drosophila guanche TaxID=7266 RepID=A0A3B0JH97_DROGU|nr:uncharacterized protein LOC117584463 isoform X2 [Drosophila guanche]SPP81774.1 blast:Zinc finger protein 346 [Drosophila guanche]
MLELKYNVNPYRRQLLVHEQAAIESAKKIFKAAAGLPKPLTPSGHVPVLVDVRCMDSKAVYHVHVNIPPNGWSSEEQDEEKCPPLRLMYPSDQHDSGLDVTTNTMGGWHNPNAEDKSLLVVAQREVHKVLPGTVRLSTNTGSPVAMQADEKIKAHFMAALHQQQSSPLYHSVLWLNECKETVEAHQPPSLQIEELVQDEPDYCVTTPETPESGNGPLSSPLNGYKPVQQQLSPSHDPDQVLVPELCLDSRGVYVPNKQLQVQQSQNPINGFRKQLQQSDSHPLMHQNELQPLPRGALMPKNGFKAGTSNQHHCSYSSRKIWPLPKAKYAHKNGFKSFAQMRNQKYSSPRSRGEQWNQKPPNTGADEPTEEPAFHRSSPQEWRNPFQWNNCRLCHKTMRTIRNAVEHYSSKEHDRRMAMRTLRMPDGGFNQSANLSNGALQELQELRSARSVDFYCELCDLMLTSNAHADQHFQGRRHRMVANKLSKPNGLGHYNADGRWVRTDKKGMNCELCDVSITSDTQMAMHMAGAKHRKRVVDCYISGHMEVPFDGSGSALKPLGPYIRKSDIFDINSGYYCDVCEIPLNHRKSAKGHMKGRLHKRNIHSFH